MLPTLVFALAAAVYLVSPIRQLADSRYALVLTHGLIANGHPYLDQYFPSEVTNARGRTRPVALPYQLDSVDGRIVYGYPWATSILSLPIVWLAGQTGLSVVDSRGQYQLQAEQALQGVTASLVTASTIALLFVIGRAFLSDRWSMLVAAGAALGTSLWTTASRVLWSHTWEVLIVTVAIYVLVRKQHLGPAVFGTVLGTLMAAALVVRPTGIIPLAALAAYLAFQRPRALTMYALVVAIWLGIAGVASLMTVGSVFSTYHGSEENLQLANISGHADRLAGLLFSPGRGLFVYSPVLAIILLLVALHWRGLPSRPLAILALGAIAVQLGLLAAWGMWWGGHSYGPRLLVDVTPWFALLAILGLRAWLDSTAGHGVSAQAKPTALGVLAGLALAVSVAMHARGATDFGTLDWNGRPDNIDTNTSRLWDWSRPPFLATEAPRRRS